jgi:hypothetical protein
LLHKAFAFKLSKTGKFVVHSYQGDQRSFEINAQNVAQPILSKLMHCLKSGKNGPQEWSTYFCNFHKPKADSDPNSSQVKCQQGVGNWLKFFK